MPRELICIRRKLPEWYLERTDHLVSSCMLIVFSEPQIMFRETTSNKVDVTSPTKVPRSVAAAWAVA
jgi:hypothetical protein